MADSVGLIRVVSPAEVTKAQQAPAIPTGKEEEYFTSELARYVRRGFEWARQQRIMSGIVNQLLSALRIYQGKYDPQKLAMIKAFQGSEVYSRITSVKCRGASALLRDIYFSGERPWNLDPTPEPTVPGNIAANVVQLVQTEVETLRNGGQQVDETAVKDRIQGLMEAAKKAEKRMAKKEADKAASFLDDKLTEGGFYTALSEMIVDLPIFPFACVKGPVVRMESQLKWQPDGTKQIDQVPKLMWYRVSPFDLYFSPGASSSQRATTYEHMRLMRSEIYDLIQLPGYNEEAIREVLNIDAARLKSWTSLFETERADLERREDPNFSSENLFIDCMEFTGYIDGKLLLDWGVAAKDIPDEAQQYYTTGWLVDQHVFKAQLSASPRQSSPYYVTSFEKIPGSVTGNGLPEILNDIQDVANATLRSMVNNLSIASGPQVVIDDTRMAPGTDSDSIYPWKRWHVISDPLNNPSKPVDFYQPTSNAQELLTVYKEFNNMADEVSAIPRYLTGSQRTGGAASTASGLAMLMNNAGKMMQNVAANIDQDVIKRSLEDLYDIVMLSDHGQLRGDEVIVVRGVTLAIKREQDRVRQLEFLSITANPLDAQIVGPRGRASVLRSVAQNIGLEYEEIVAEDETIQKEIQQQQMQVAQANATGDAAPGPDASRTEQGTPRLNSVSNTSTT
jgi:hypothetical protein